MSARSGVFVFDYDVHINCVAPAVRRVLTRHELGPWLQEVWDARQRRFSPQSRRAFRHPEVAELPRTGRAHDHLPGAGALAGGRFLTPPV